jgi:hypothetical protein
MAPGESQTSFLNPGNQAAKEPRNIVPWVLAGIVVVIIAGVLLFLGSYHKAPANPGGAGLAAPDPYAANLAFSDIKMSESSSMAGAKQTYLDGVIVNHGNKTLTALTMQVAFHDYTHQLVQKETLPLSLIRTREPYVDTEPVSAASIKPGDSREFRLIFDHVADGWNQEYPELRVIQVESR